MKDIQKIKKGIKIILDGVFSHTGEESIYFDRSGLHTTHLPEEEPVPEKKEKEKKEKSKKSDSEESAPKE